MKLKERIIQMSERLSDPVTYDRLISCLSVMDAIGMDRNDGTELSDAGELFSTFLGEVAYATALQANQPRPRSNGARKRAKLDEAVTMTKEQLLNLINRLHADITIQQVIYKIALLKEVQIGIQQLDRGEGTDHDEFFDELLRENEDEKAQDRLVSPSKKKPGGHQKIHQPRVAKNGQEIHQATKAVRKKA